MQGFDEHLAREFVQGLVLSAISRGLDPVARLEQFRALQQAVILMTTDPAATWASKQIVCAVDHALHDLAAAKL